MKKAITTLALLLAFGITFAVQLQISPSVQEVSRCPNISEEYEVSAVSGTLPACTYIWNVQGGVITSSNQGQTVLVKWDDETGKGTLTVTANGCPSSGDNGSTVSAQYTRLSVFGRAWPTPSAYLTSINVPLCDPPAYIDIGVDHLYVQNTGAIGEPPLKEVDIYVWSIPAGWKQDVTNIAGPALVNTVINSLRLVPTGTVGGSLVVTGRVSATCPGTLASNAKMITLNRTPAISVTPQAGFTSAVCGLTAPVTFTTTSLPCATGYTWQKPSGWSGSSSTSSITLTPDGTSGGAVAVTISLNGGGTVSGSYTVLFNNSAPTTPGFTDDSNNFEMCSGETRIFTVTPPAGFPANYGYQFYVDGAALLVENQSTSQGSPYSTTSNQVTVSCPGQAYGNAFVLVRMYRAGCTPSGYANIQTRAGVYNSNEFTMFGPSQICPNTAVDFVSSYIGGDILDYQWTAPGGWSSSGQGTPYFHVSVPWSFSGGEAITLRLQNRCGYTNTPSVKPLFPGFGCGGFFSLNANPVSDEVIIDTPEPNAEISARLINDHTRLVRNSEAARGQLRLNVSDVPNGIYVLEIHSKQNIETQRIVVKH